MPRLRHLVPPALVLILGCAALYRLLLSAQTRPRLLHSEPSQFGEVLVFEQHGERCLNFNSMTDVSRQTCMSLDAPDALLFAYTRMMISALYVKPDPTRILIVGLGGATLQKTLAGLLPEASIETVEIDPAVVQAAESWFAYRQGPNQRLFIEDGRTYIEQAHQAGRHYDIVMLDAFDVDYIPQHLTTVEFLQHVKAILAPDGIVVANTFTSSQRYEQESATYAAVFGEFFNLRRNNRVIVASREALPDENVIARRAEEWAPRLAPLGIQKDQALQWFSERSQGASDGVAILRD